MIERIQECFASDEVLYSKHARDEMEHEGFGEISVSEVQQAIRQGKVIESYPDDEPYPSCLIFGKTLTERPVHIVCAYSADDNRAIVITVYQPDPAKWEEFERRKT